MAISNYQIFIHRIISGNDVLFSKRITFFSVLETVTEIMRQWPATVPKFLPRAGFRRYAYLPYIVLTISMGNSNFLRRGIPSLGAEVILHTNRGEMRIPKTLDLSILEYLQHVNKELIAAKDPGSGL